MSLFQRRTLDDYADSLAAYMPGDRLFASKSIQNSNLRLLTRGLSGELFRANGSLRGYDIIPDETENFLNEWDSALGIPDSCFSGTGTIDERRRDILTKLSALGIQTEDDFIDLAALFGITITINQGIEGITFPLTFPVLMFNSEKEARFTIIINFTVEEANRFPLEFPFVFGDGEIAILECLFSKLKPANCNLLFRQV